MADWIDALDELARKGTPSVLLTVGEVRGSAPRETGAKMIVTPTETIGTIGGGQLEHQCVQVACRQLAGADFGREPTSSRRFVLGSNCGQCCGGVVNVMFESLPASRADWLTVAREHFREQRPAVIATSLNGGAKSVITMDGCAGEAGVELLDAARDMLAQHAAARIVDSYLLEPSRTSDFSIAVFGAGHVGTAVVDILSRLDCSIRWIDNRRQMFPANLPAGVTAIEASGPAREVAAMPAGSFYLVMTHSHPLDLDICAQVLQRDDAAYCGLIGSASKRRRFERLLTKQGLTVSSLQNLVCPIGVPGIAGKKPAEIALAVAAELLQVRDRRAPARQKTEFMEVRG